MTTKQELFCRYYIKYKNATRAAIEAGYSRKTAYEIGSKLLRKFEIISRINILRSEYLEVNGITENRLMDEKASIAFSNITDHVKWKTLEYKKGDKVIKTIDLEVLDSDITDSRAVKEFSHSCNTGTKIKMYNKLQAIDSLLDDIRRIKDMEDDDEFYELDNIRIVPHFEKWFNEEYEKHLFSVLKGGRSSGKSTSVARRLVKDILMYPVNILVVRKVHSTIIESCYEELKQAINDMGIADEFRFIAGNKPEIRRIRTGQKFIFRGGQEPEKIKSIKTSKFPIARVWFEEVIEFKNYDEIRIIIDSIVRANLKDGLEYRIILTYNPAKRKQHWANKRYNTQFIPDNTYVDHSTSFDNPHLSKAFLQEAENVKKVNELAYRWNYLGEAIGGGITPFHNLEFREISDYDIGFFDNICQGIDWGFAVDPVCFLRMYYDKTRMELYIFGEIYGVKISNARLAEMIKNKSWNDYEVTADSAEPKSVNDLVVDGINCISAKKGPGSIEHGLEWLDSLNKIIIDPVRCPNTAKEYEDIDYKLDKDGNVVAELEDKDDHSIDCTRYAVEKYTWKRKDFFKSKV